jgi:hypothetical protein
LTTSSATATATTEFNKNKMTGETVSVTTPAYDTVQVTTSYNASAFFAKLFGQSSVTVSATATAKIQGIAGASAPGVTVGGLVGGLLGRIPRRFPCVPPYFGGAVGLTSVRPLTEEHAAVRQRDARTHERPKVGARRSSLLVTKGYDPTWFGLSRWSRGLV